MILYILRHGIAEDTGPGGDDRARRLTPRGRLKMRAAATGMQRLGLRFDVLLTSPLVRAKETAAIVAEGYGGNPDPRELAALASGMAPADTVRALRPYARHAHVLIVGHEPGLSGVAALLLTGSSEGFALDLKKGGLLALQLDGSPAPGGATLRWVLTPRQLRRLAR